MTEIEVAGGLIALVDDDLAPLIGQFRWRPSYREHTTYAQTTLRYAPSQRELSLHRFVIGARRGQLVDHRNGNGLDCQRANLRVATPGQNKANGGPQRISTTGYRGVMRKPSGNYIARIRVPDGRRLNLGTYTDAWPAAEAYNHAALNAWGEFAWQNVRQP